MRQLFGVVCACLGCGRVGFDASAASTDGAPADAAPLADQIAAALPCETDVVLRAVPLADQLGWLQTPGVEAVVALHHLDATHHELRVYPLEVTDGTVANSISALAFAIPDMYGLSIARTGTGYGVAFTSIADSTLHVMTLDASFAAQSDTPVTGLGGALVPFAQSSAGQLLVGMDGAGGIAVVAIDASATVSGQAVTIDSGPDDQPSIAPLGADFVVSWRSTTSGACRFARIDLAGTLRAGPLSITPPNVGCVRPEARALPTGAVAIAIHDPGSAAPVAYAATIDPTFTAVSAPIAVGDLDSVVMSLVADTDRAQLAVRTSGDSRIAQVLSGGAASIVGADFGLNGTDTDTETLASIGGALVHARTESGMLQLRKLCR